MWAFIALYGTEVEAVKKAKRLLGEVCERLELPEEAVAGAAKLTVTAGRSALVENHRGLLEYGAEQIRVGTGRGQIVLRGSGLTLAAMNGEELLIRGALQSVEWE